MQIEERMVTGITIRTKNADEMNPDTAKIGGLWQNFYEKIAPSLRTGATVFGVYYDYESDASGVYGYAGSDGMEESPANHLESVSIRSGSYLMLEAKEICRKS